MESFLGTTWFIILVGVVSFCFGVWMAPRVKRMLSKG